LTVWIRRRHAREKESVRIGKENQERKKLQQESTKYFSNGMFVCGLTGWQEKPLVRAKCPYP
jgi:hypothetical protein